MGWLQKNHWKFGKDEDVEEELKTEGDEDEEANHQKDAKEEEVSTP